MKLRETTRKIISRLEEISGYSVQVVEDKNLSVPASLRIARGQLPAHILSFNALHGSSLDFIICWHCALALRLFERDADQRFQIASSPESSQRLDEILFAPNGVVDRYGLDPNSAASLRDQLIQGLIVHLYSMAVGLRVSDKLTLDFPELLEFESEHVEKELQANLSGLSEQVRQTLPREVFEATHKINTAQDDGEIQITWKPNPKKSPLDKVAEILKSGKLDDGILLLELFLSDDPNDGDVLFNLGMAYSDTGELNHAIEHLHHLVKSDPNHTHGRVALGVALLRARKTDEGIHELETAVSQKPNDLWARRNLGAGLMQAEQFTKAVEHLRQATVISPDDQAAWYGLGQALQFSGETLDADKAYIKAIELDEFSDVAELARKARTKIAEKGFHTAAGNAPRMDAVMYCLSALRHFDKLPLEKVRQIGFEIALLGTRGLDVNSAEQKYTLKSMEGNFSGLHLVCLQYVAFKKIAPDQSIGFDLSTEYRTALNLFGKE